MASYGAIPVWYVSVSVTMATTNTDIIQVTGLRRLMRSFEPSKRLTFVDTHNQDFPFPFSEFAENHHISRPDISVSFPISDRGGTVVPIVAGCGQALRNTWQE